MIFFERIYSELFQISNKYDKYNVTWKTSYFK